MAKRGKRDVLENFSADAMVEGTLRVYEKVDCGKRFSMAEKIKRMLFFGKTRKRTQTPSFFIKAFRNQGINVHTINYRKMERRWGKWLTEKYLFSTLNRFQPQLIFINTIDIPFKILSQISKKTKVAIYLPDLIALSDNSSSSGLITPYKEEMIERGKLADYFFITNQGQISFLKEQG